MSIEADTPASLLFVVFGGLRFGALRPSVNPAVFAPSYGFGTTGGNPPETGFPNDCY